MTSEAAPQLRVLRAGSNFVSQDPAVVHVGLGTNPHAEVEVRWPSGQRLVVPRVLTSTRDGDNGSCTVAVALCLESRIRDADVGGRRVNASLRLRCRPS